MLLRFWLAGVADLLLGDPGLALPSATEGPPPLRASSSHSLHLFHMAVSEPNQEHPWFIAMRYMDDQLIGRYDSNTRKVQPQVHWMEKAQEDDPTYWERKTRTLQHTELRTNDTLETLESLYNQSGGFHTWQWVIGCELRQDGSKGGYSQYAYDGKDFLHLDPEIPAWTATDPMAQITARRWEKAEEAKFQKTYLEENCIKWLQRYLDYGKERLLRTESPVGKVTHTSVPRGKEMLICQAYGFYPKEIEGTGRKGEEILEHETFRRNVVPNSDGTYHSWLSIEIDPADRNLYRCHIDHAGLTKPLVLTWKASANVRLIVAAILGVLVLLLLAAAGIAWICRNRQGREAY